MVLAQQEQLRQDKETAVELQVRTVAVAVAEPVQSGGLDSPITEAMEETERQVQFQELLLPMRAVAVGGPIHLKIRGLAEVAVGVMRGQPHPMVPLAQRILAEAEAEAEEYSKLVVTAVPAS